MAFLSLSLLHTSPHPSTSMHRCDDANTAAQQAVARALQAPLCVESKHLPDFDGIKDRMTLLAVENGMPGGIQPQAAAMVLSALQSHLQNVASSIITKIRANRADGIRTNEPLRPAAADSGFDGNFATFFNRDGSPALDAMDVDDESGGNSPAAAAERVLRSVQSDLSSRASTTASTATNGVGMSLADSSMLSLPVPLDQSSWSQLPRHPMAGTVVVIYKIRPLPTVLPPQVLVRTAVGTTSSSDRAMLWNQLPSIDLQLQSPLPLSRPLQAHVSPSPMWLSCSKWPPTLWWNRLVKVRKNECLLQSGWETMTCWRAMKKLVTLPLRLNVAWRERQDLPLRRI